MNKRAGELNDEEVSDALVHQTVVMVVLSCRLKGSSQLCKTQGNIKSLTGS